MSSRDFPGPSWEDGQAPADWRADNRPADEEAYGQRAAAGRSGTSPSGYPQYGQSDPYSRSQPAQGLPAQSWPALGQPGQSQPARAGYDRRDQAGNGSSGYAGGHRGRGRAENGRGRAENGNYPASGNGNGYGGNGNGYAPGVQPSPYPSGSASSSDAGSGEPRTARGGRPAASRRGSGGYRGESASVPRDGTSVPPDGYGRSLPRDGYGTSVPRDGRGGGAGDGYAGGAGAGAGYRNGLGSQRNGSGDDRARSRDDSGIWYRMTGRFDTTGFGLKALRSNRTSSARPGYYNPDEDPGFGDRATGRYGGAAFAPGNRPGQPGAPGPGGQPGRAGRPGRPGAGVSGPGGRGPRGYVNPDDGAPLPKRILRKIWYGTWWRRWTIKKVALLMGGIAAFTALALIASFFTVLSATRVPIVKLSAPLDQSSIVYFSNNREVGCFCTTNRTNLSEAKIKKSKLLWEAVLAAEDRNFFTEGGVSLTGILRAAKADLSGGGNLQGGSTITEQFVKRYYDPTGLGNLTYKTKIKEIFVAIKLAKMEPKWWILWHYLNAIPLGAGAYGVQAAAETYFHVKAWQLTVAQAAMIAAMVQAPYGYEPTNPKSVPSGLPNSLLERWVYVLTNMVRDGAITQDQFSKLVPDPNAPNSALKNFPKVTIRSVDSTWPGYRGYIMALVAGELHAYYGLPSSIAQLGNLGLQIHTTINENLMRSLNRSIVAEKKQISELMGQPMPYYINISAVLEKPGTGNIVAFYGGKGFGAKDCPKYHCQLNSILAPEPVGSSFKPYVLATAVSQGMDVRDSVMNSHSPLCIPPDYTTTLRLQLAKQTRNCPTPEGYQFFDESSEDSGRINESVAGATATSNDPAYEDLIHRTSIQSVINMAGTLGVSSSDVYGLNKLFGNGCRKINPICTPGTVQAALGEGDLTAVDQANTFSTLVSGGVSVTPHIIGYLIKNGVRESAHVVKTHALQPEVAGDTDWALSFDTSSSPPGGGGVGTGVPNAIWDRPMIAKTGTLGVGAFASQAWFVGAIPQYSMAVGMFTDRPNGTHKQILDVLPSAGPWSGGYGGAWPATIWHTFMSQQFSGLPIKALPPEGFTGSNPLFVKWVMAPKIKPKKKKCPPPFGHGHHRFFGNGHGNGNQCTGANPGPNPSGPPNPNPNPTPTGFPTPSPPALPSPTPSGSPSPSPSVTPSPNPSAQLAKRPARRTPHHTTGIATSSALVPTSTEKLRRLGWATTTTLT